MNQLFIISISINIICHLILTRPYGAIGAAWSALITQLITMLVLGYFINRQKLAFINHTILKFILLTLISAFGLGLITDQFSIMSEYKVVLQCILIPATLAGFGLIPFKSIFAFIKTHRIK